MGTVFAREKMHILLNKSQSRTGEKKHTGTQEYNMETISQLGSVIKLTVLFNLMPAITRLCSSVFLLEFVASNFCNGGIRKKTVCISLRTCCFSLLCYIKAKKFPLKHGSLLSS